MATNFVGDNRFPTIILLADCVAGEFVVNGFKHGVAVNAGVAGEEIAIQTFGRFNLAKETETQDAGVPLFYNGSTKKFQKAATADGLVRGYVNVAATADDATVEVALCPAQLSGESTLPVNIPYTNDGLAGVTEVGGALDALVTAADDVVHDDDARLSDARTPTDHAASHATAGTDAITPADIGAATDDHTHDAAEVAYTNGAVPAVADIGGAMDAVIDYLRQLPKVKRITVSSSLVMGTSDGDTALAGGAVQSIVPVSGNDQPVASVAIDGTTGVITLTLADASTAEATFDVWVKPVLPAP